MEKNITNDLQEMQEQLGLLHHKLDKQTILDDKQLARIPHMRVSSIKAVSVFWLVLAIVAMVIFDGFYGLYYYSLNHFDQVMEYCEKNMTIKIDSTKISPEKLEQINKDRQFFQEKIDWLKELKQNDPEKWQKAMDGVKEAIYTGWMLVLNILITFIFITVAITQVFHIRYLKRGKIRENISTLTEQMRKVRKTHMIGCAVIMMLIALVMPIILEFYKDLALGWRIVLIAVPALLSIAEFIQFTSLTQYTAVRYLDWGKIFYIRHTCDKIIHKMEG